MEKKKPSAKVRHWAEFSEMVEDHITHYVIPQYGDHGEDEATNYTAEDCIKQVRKYVGRFGRSSRPGEEVLDLVKAAHYLQIAAKLIRSTQ